MSKATVNIPVEIEYWGNYCRSVCSGHVGIGESRGYCRYFPIQGTPIELEGVNSGLDIKFLRCPACIEATNKEEAPDGWKSESVECMDCNHKWVAVVPVGVNVFQCPKCFGMMGFMQDLTTNEVE